MIDKIFKDVSEIRIKPSILETIAENVVLQPIDELNKSIDRCSLYAKDASREGLSSVKFEELKEETGWSDKVIESIRSDDEARIYENAELKCEAVGGKDALVRTDIDYELEVDGEKNLERMRQGKCPRTADGENIELHHIGQNAEAPLAELTTTEHRGSDNDMILHDKTKESQIDRNAFRQQREEYWKARAEELDSYARQ